MKAVVDREELEAFLNFVADKAKDVYEREVTRAVERFLGRIKTKKAVVNREELEAFLNFVADKAEDVYEREVDRAVKRFLGELK